MSSEERRETNWKNTYKYRAGIQFDGEDDSARTLTHTLLYSVEVSRDLLDYAYDTTSKFSCCQYD